MIQWFKNLFKKKKTAKSMRDSNEPWVNVIQANVDRSNPKQGYFELEWNPAFVLFLREHGYRGSNPEDIVDQWFTDLCRNISLDDQAEGSFIADAGRLNTIQKTKNQ